MLKSVKYGINYNPFYTIHGFLVKGMTPVHQKNKKAKYKYELKYEIKCGNFSYH